MDEDVSEAPTNGPLQLKTETWQPLQSLVMEEKYGGAPGNDDSVLFLSQTL